MELLRSWLRIVGVITGSLAVLVTLFALVAWVWSELGWLFGLPAVVLGIGIVIGTLIWAAEEFA